MQLASLIIASASLAVSATTLVVILVALKRGSNLVAEVAAQADGKVQALKNAVADL